MNDKVYITEALEKLNQMPRMRDSKKSLKESSRRRLKEDYKDTYRGYTITEISGPDYHVEVTDEDGQFEGNYTDILEAKASIDLQIQSNLSEEALSIINNACRNFIQSNISYGSELYLRDIFKQAVQNFVVFK